MRTVLLVVVLVVAVLLVIFGAQNTQPVSINFLGLSTGFVSLSLVIIVSAVVGVVMAALVSFWTTIRRNLGQRRVDKEYTDIKKRNAELEARLSTVERENADLKVTASTVAVPAPQTEVKTKAKSSGG